MDGIRSTEWFLLMAMAFHVFIAPFTKVEESFNIQAVHDIVFHRTNLSEYDRVEFPGVVPRTFVGPLILGSIILPFKPVFDWFNLQKYWFQFAARFLLGFFNIFAFCSYVRCVETWFGRRVGSFLRLITLSQFHFLFYASRTLPNGFAMVLVLYTFKNLLDDKIATATVLASAATLLFRFELIILFGPLFLVTFLARGIRFFVLIRLAFVSVLTGLLTLAISVPIDSYFWDRWVWPEGEVINFNILENRSHEYGTSPFWWYFTSALPRALLFTSCFVPFGLLIRNKSPALLLLPTITFIILYSFLPHKELRFILYSVPLMNLSASVFCDWAWLNRSKSRAIFKLLVVLQLIGNLFCTPIFTYTSSRNYPGGTALAQIQYLHRFMKNKPISIHIDEYSAQTGVTRFIELFNAWEYNKTEGLNHEELTRFDYLLIGNDFGTIRKIATKDFNETHREYIFTQSFDKISFYRLPPKLSSTLNDLLPKLLYEMVISTAKYPWPIFKDGVVVMKKRDS